jgi:Beta/Gamma crystallin
VAGPRGGGDLGRAGELPQIIAFNDFTGDHTHIVGDMRRLGKWDYSISSTIILSGTCEFFDGDDFTGTKMGSLGPGRYPRVTEKGFKDNRISSIRLVSPAAEGRRVRRVALQASGQGERGGDLMAQDTGIISSEAEATRAAMMACLDTLRTDSQEVLDGLKRTADQLLDHVLAEQLPWARETLERLASLVDHYLVQGQATAGAVLAQAKHAVPHVTAAQQHPWVLLGSALLVGYLVGDGGARAPAPAAPAQPRRAPMSPASGQP